MADGRGRTLGIEAEHDAALGKRLAHRLAGVVVDDDRFETVELELLGDGIGGKWLSKLDDDIGNDVVFAVDFDALEALDFVGELDNALAVAGLFRFPPGGFELLDRGDARRDAFEAGRFDASGGLLRCGLSGIGFGGGCVRLRGFGRLSAERRSAALGERARASVVAGCRFALSLCKRWNFKHECAR